MYYPRIKNVTLTLATIGLALTAGCSQTPSNRPVPKYSDATAPITHRVGEEFMVVLPSNPTTGYTWEFAEPVNEKILRPICSGYQAPDDQIPGKGGQAHWTFQAVNKGTTVIKLNYIRPWEKKTAPAKTAVFRVTVE